MFLTNKSTDKMTNDSMFVESNVMTTTTTMVNYNQINGTTSMPMSNGSNNIPKIKVEDITYQSDGRQMNWQTNDCYQQNQFNGDNCMYQNDGRVETNTYSDPSMTSGCANGLVYTDLSNQYNESAVNGSNYQMVYSQNPIPPQNGSIQGFNQTNYENRVEAGPQSDMLSTTPSSAITEMDSSLSVSPGADQRSDSLQTLEPTVMSALNDSENLKNIHFIKTIEFLRATDLLNLTLQTAELIKKNLEIQKEINNTKQLLSRFVTT